MLMETMPEVLTWRAGTDVMERVYRDYVGLLSDRLGELLGTLLTADPKLGQALDATLRSSSDSAFSRVLTAPETSYRLIWKPETAPQLGHFILAALRAEERLAGVPMRFEAEAWTALGDVGFFPDGRIERQPQLSFEMPLDFGSPLARAVDLGNGDTTTPREPFTPAERARVLSLLGEACAGIERVNSLILAFTVRFNKVLVLQKDSAEPNNFTSGSTGQYVGRSFLTNPHLDGVHVVAVAESLVHEAIHALLYMQERRKAWVSTSLYQGPQVLISPWTGSRLALRPFMQACFVWYGLLNLWCAALLAGQFEPLRVRARIAVALQGFLEGRLIERLAPWRADISDDVVEAIAVLQDQVCRTMTEAA